jgi:hypothetical protein
MWDLSILLIAVFPEHACPLYRRSLPGNWKWFNRCPGLKPVDIVLRRGERKKEQ